MSQPFALLSSNLTLPLLLLLTAELFHRFGGFVGGDAQRAKEAPIVGGHFERTARLHDPAGAATLRARRSASGSRSPRQLRASLSSRTRRACFLAAGLY